MKVNYHLLKDSLVLNYGGKTIPLSRKLPLVDKILELIRAGKDDEIPELVDYAERLKKIDPTKLFVLVDGKVFSHGVEVEPYISKRLIELHELQLPLDPLINFWKKSLANPSAESRRDLFKFVEHNKFPLTHEGNFIAYKKVSPNFKDLYTGNIDNSVGQEVTMDRSKVNPDRNQTCSRGLHVAAYDYAKFHYGNGNSSNIMLEVEVDPKDVVSVPTDYNAQKCRACRYLVVGVSGGEIQDDIIDADELKKYHAQVGQYVEDEDESTETPEVGEQSGATSEVAEEVVTVVEPVEEKKKLPKKQVKDPVKKRDNRSSEKKEKKDKNAPVGEGIVEIGRAYYTLSWINKPKFSEELKALTYKSICAYDQAQYFKTLDPAPTKVYRAKVGNDKKIFRYLVIQVKEGVEEYFLLEYDVKLNSAS